MNTNPNSKMNYQQLIQQINSRIEELASATDAARMSEDMLRYLDAFSRFHRYSLYNAWLILMARPDATHVAGFHAWNSYNRFVRKAERGIAILAPMFVRKETQDKEDQTVLRGFKIVYVFDISQTDGEPLPEAPDWKSPERDALLMTRLLAFAKQQGIEVIERQIAGEIQGISHGGIIEISTMAGTSTLLHELAHEMMHKCPDAPTERVVRELEAESVSYTVGRHFGLGSAGSPNYISLHGASSKLILEHLERISKISAKLILELEKEDTLDV